MSPSREDCIRPQDLHQWRDKLLNACAHVYLTRNEFKCPQPLDTWRLAIVTTALTRPVIQGFTTLNMANRFGFEPLARRATLKEGLEG